MAEVDATVGVEAAGHVALDIESDERACYAPCINRRPPVPSLTSRNGEPLWSRCG